MMPNQWINPQRAGLQNQQVVGLGGKNKGPRKSVQKKKGKVVDVNPAPNYHLG
jgi:hypothetical protein